MKFWFTMQHPRVLSYQPPGLWLTDRWLRRRGWEENDEVVIYEIRYDEDGRACGLSAARALLKVIRNTEERDETKWIRVAVGKYIAADTDGCCNWQRTLEILGYPGANQIVLQNVFSNRVSEISRAQYENFCRYFRDY